MTKTGGTWTWNILDGGFSDEGAGARISNDASTNFSGPLSTFIKEQISPFYDTLAMQELLNWSVNDSDTQPGMASLAAAWDFEHFHLCEACDSYRVGIMSHSPIDVLAEIAVTHGILAARTNGIVHIVTHTTPFSSEPDNPERNAEVDSIVALAGNYSDEPLLLMGDFNNPSPMDLARYDLDLVCRAGGTSYCTHNKTEVDFTPIQKVLDAGLVDLCWTEFNTTTGAHQPSLYNACANSCSTSIWGGSPPLAKIDYIFANEAFLQTNAVLHSRVQTSGSVDQCSDHYPVEVTFSAISP